METSQNISAVYPSYRPRKLHFIHTVSKGHRQSDRTSDILNYRVAMLLENAIVSEFFHGFTEIVLFSTAS